MKAGAYKTPLFSFLFLCERMQKMMPDSLKNFFITHNKIALAFSGGTDSSFLLYAAVKYGCDIKAYYVKSAFQPEFEYNDALKLAKSLNTPIKIITENIFSKKDVIKNDALRCYYCKQTVFSAICAAAKDDGYGTVIDGTNASDKTADRPGMKALEEMRILSPLKACGIDKAAVRELSKEAHLPTWDKPAYSCLATRIKTGVAITPNLLEKTEKSESYLFSLGFSDFRVRTDGNSARLELKENDFHRLADNRQRICEYLGDLFDNITLNLNAR